MRLYIHMQSYILDKLTVATEMDNGLVNAASASKQWSHCSTLNRCKNYRRSLILVMLKYGIFAFAPYLNNSDFFFFFGAVTIKTS